jgi:hypothetical protein
MSKWQFLIQKIWKRKKKFTVNFFQFLVFKTLDPDRTQVRIGIQPTMLDPDPKQWFVQSSSKFFSS